MDIYGFAAALAKRVIRQVPIAHLRDEGEFERKHVVGPAWELSEKHPEIRVLVHPEKREKKCRGGCDAGDADPSRRVLRLSCLLESQQEMVCCGSVRDSEQLRPGCN
jgi:hypothetical protein